MNLNHITLAGNLVKQPELRYTPSGTPSCNFTIANNRQWKDKSGEMKKETSFISVTAWGKTAEMVNQYLTKGSGVCVEGRIKQDVWEKDGAKQYKVYIIAERVHFVGAKKEGGQEQPADDNFEAQE